MMHRYEEFCRRVRVAQGLVEQGLVGSLTVSPQELAAAIAAVQQVLDDASDSDASDKHTARIEAIQVEIHKQLRLLRLDQMFLNAARQTNTLHQRFQQINGRLELLASYGLAILEQPPT